MVVVVVAMSRARRVMACERAGARTYLAECFVSGCDVYVVSKTGRHNGTTPRPAACAIAGHPYTDVLLPTRHTMSADAPANLQVFSPTGSGRSSPVPRSTRNATEDCRRQTLPNLDIHTD
jgi:hypothetical protein